MAVNPGVFRNIEYVARFQDGYEMQVTTGVTLSADVPGAIDIAGQSIKVDPTAQPGDYVVTGEYTDFFGTTEAATTTITMYGPRTTWERVQLTGGGYGLSGAWSPDQTTLAWGSSSGAVNFYTVGLTPSQYELEAVHPAHDGRVVFVDYLSATSFVTVSDDGTIKSWSISNGVIESVSTYAHSAPLLSAARLDNKLAFGDSMGGVGLFDLDEWDDDWYGMYHDAAVLSVALDEEAVLSGGADDRATVLQVSDGTELRNILTHTQPVVSVGFMGTNLFFTLSEDQTASFWDRTTFDIVDRYEYPSTPTHGEYIGNQLYVSTVGPVATWIYNSDGLLLRWLEHPPDRGEVEKILIDPSGQYLLTGRSTSTRLVESLFGGLTEVTSSFASFQFWELGRGIFRGSLAHSFPLTAAHASMDTQRIFTQSPKRTLVWHNDPNGATATEDRLLETGYFINPSFSGMDFTADSNTMVTQVDQSIFFFDTENFLLDKTLQTLARVFSISPDGSRIATSQDTVRLWDTTNLSLINEESRVLSGIDFRGNDHFLGAVNADNFVGVWNESGLLFNGVETVYAPSQIFVNSTGERCAVITVEVMRNLLSTTYRYYFEFFDISDIDNEPGSVGPPIFLLQTMEDIFSGGSAQASFNIAVSDDNVLALVGASDDNPVRLLNLNDGTTIREFLPPGGAGLDNLGASSVQFTDNDTAVMIAWGEGYAELYRRKNPTDLRMELSFPEGGAPKILADRKGAAPGQPLAYLVKPGDEIVVSSFAQYEDGGELNVTASSVLSSGLGSPLTIEGATVRVSEQAAYGDVILSSSYE
ncbi:MAG: WD40 repeat domain-containing protein, partial [Candidatus Omnitrophica bacterium]|nr:WD40 repeat domain-containing protein [Candidatus Omnitrophota bacterium]